MQRYEALLVAFAAHQQHAGARRRGIGGQGQSLADAHARGIEGLEQRSPAGIAGLPVEADRGIGRKPVRRFQERLRLGYRQDEGQFAGRFMADRWVVGSREPRSSAIRNLCRPRATVIRRAMVEPA